MVRSIGSTPGGVAMGSASAGGAASPAGLERGEAEPASNTITKTVDKHGCCAFSFPCFNEFAGSKGVRQGTVSQQTSYVRGESFWVPLCQVLATA